jgi:TRAP-type mannitol/chloroaromatic compound transport system substrate-binding protein
MDRRRFFRKAAASAIGTLGATTLAAPAVAQSRPKVTWRCTSSFPKSLDVIFGGAVNLANEVRNASDGDLEIQVFAANEIVPGLQAADAVINGTVPMCHTATYYYIGKDPTYAFGAAVPFGLNARGLQAWLYGAGGLELLNEFFHTQGLHYLPGGNTGAQMGGWFRKPINGLEDLKGIKMRIPGLAGRTMQKLGVVPQQIAAGDIYASLERGVIDGAEWVGPYDDEKLGFYKIAPYYYYPGWWEGAQIIGFLFNKQQFEELPPYYRSILETAARSVTTKMLADYDVKNAEALYRVVKNGAQLRAFSPEIMQASFAAAQDLYKELNASSVNFKKIYDSMMAFRNDSFLWEQLADYSYDAFMMVKQRDGALKPA